jgi:serine/threonine protein kinase
MNEVENEVQAIKNLCGPTTDKHIVKVLNHGHLFDSQYYFIDMELCDINLHDYIHCDVLPDWSRTIPLFIRNAEPFVEVQQIWDVMSQIAKGVEYIHKRGHVHRDIKPANSKFLIMRD